MKLGKAEKKFVRKNCKEMTLAQLSQETGVNPKEIKKYLWEFRKEAKKPEPTSARPIKLFVMLTLLIGAVYGYALSGKLISGDDVATIQVLQSTGSLMGVLKTHGLYALPEWVVLKVVGINPFILHLLSVLSHVLTTLLVFKLVNELFDRRMATLSALIFAVHPVNSEAVSWVSGFVYLAEAALCFATLIFFIRFSKTKKPKFLGASVVLYLVYIAGVKSPWALTVPPILITIDQLIIEKKLNLRKIPHYLPHLGLALIFAALFVTKMYSERMSTLKTMYSFSGDAAPFFTRLPYTIYSTWELLILPINLSIFHEGTKILQEQFAIMVLVSLATPMLVLWTLRKNRIAAALILSIFISVLPTLSPIQVAFFVAERYLYVGSAFFCVLLVLAASSLGNKLRTRNFATIAIAIIVVLFSVRTFIRVLDWHDSLSLWGATSRAAPLSPRVHNNVGDAYAQKGDFDSAIRSFEHAAELDPSYTDAIYNAGITLLKAGKTDEAKTKFQRVLEINGEHKLAKERLRELN